MANKTGLLANINLKVYQDGSKNQHHLKIEGDIETISESLAATALYSLNFERAIELAILKIREAKATQQPNDFTQTSK